MSRAELDALKTRYDWVFNARRSIVESNLSAVSEELGRVIAQLMRDEPSEDGRG